MATITNSLSRFKVGNAWVATWAGMGNADTGTAAILGEASDKSVQVTGTFGGATVTIQGSIDGTNFYTLTTPAGAALTFTSAGIGMCLEHVPYMRPSTSGGSGTNLTVSLFLRGQYV